MKQIDLHIHSSASDGTDSPAEVVRKAGALDLAAVAITDHDTVAGCAEAAAEGQKLGVEAVSGVELTSRYGRTIHILGYYLRTNSPVLTRTLDRIISERDERNRKMARMMAADGIAIDYDEMKSRFGSSIGRPHFGRVLVEQGLAESVQDAFDRYIEKGQRYYLPRWICGSSSSTAWTTDCWAWSAATPSMTRNRASICWPLPKNTAWSPPAAATTMAPTSPIWPWAAAPDSSVSPPPGWSPCGPWQLPQKCAPDFGRCADFSFPMKPDAVFSRFFL